MAFVRLTHGGMLVPRSLYGLNMSPQTSNRPELSSTYDKVSFAGQFVHPDGPGSYDITRVGFLFGDPVTKTGGSALTVSLQDISTSGTILEPDGTQDQTVAISNADANFATDTWYRTDALSSNRTISHGDYLALVIEFDGAGHQGSDLIRFQQMFFQNDDNSSRTMRYNGSTWSSFGYMPNCVFEITDGSFGSFSDAFVCDSQPNAYLYDTADNPNEYANSYTPEANIKIDAFAGIFRPPNGEDVDLVVYEGTTAIHTTTINSNKVSLVDNHIWTAPLDSEVELTAGTKYYISLKAAHPTSTCRLYYRKVNDTGHLGVDPYMFGDETVYHRNGGAWTQVTDRQLMMGVRISSIDDGAGGGGGSASSYSFFS
jgi:hypothetical protein